jgi:hypothetical protein
VPALPTIHVSEKAANFSYDCNSTKVFYSNSKSSIEKGVPLNANDNYVRILVRVTSTTPGAEFRIETDRVNGVKFTAEGILNAGANTITMEGEGTPLKSGTFNYTISGNNVNSTVTCSAEVNVMYTSDIKVLLISSNDIYTISDDKCAIPRMANYADSIFDFGKVPGAPIHIREGAIKIFKKGDGSQSNNLPLDTFMKYHLVVVSYNCHPSENMYRALCNYVKAGRTCLITSDYDIIYTPRLTRVINILSYDNDNTSNTYYTSQGDGPNTYTFIGGNLAVNGKFKDLTNHHLGRDGGGNFLFKNLPDDWIVLAATNNSPNPRENAKLIMHNRYRMFLAGDGGIFAGGEPGYNVQPNGAAARVSSTANHCMPIPATNGSFAAINAYNAHFLANLMIWAFEAANE